MSGIFDFVKKLLPRIERSSVEEDLRLTEKEIVNITIPAYAAAKDFLTLNPPKSKQFTNLHTSFYQIANTPKYERGTTFISDINSRLYKLHEIIIFLQAKIGDELDKDIVSAGLTMRAAFIIRSAANISHVSRYMLSLLNYIYTVEAAARNTDAPSHALEISKQEMRYVETNFTRFVTLLMQYSIEAKNFEKLVKELPEVYVNENTKKAVLATSKTDGANQSFVSGFVGSPIYAIGLVIAQWQNNRYESAKAKKTQLELRLLYLKNKAEGDHEDPAIEREIGRLQDRIEKLDRSIHETEEKILGD